MSTVYNLNNILVGSMVDPDGTWPRNWLPVNASITLNGYPKRIYQIRYTRYSDTDVWELNYAWDSRLDPIYYTAYTSTGGWPEDHGNYDNPQQITFNSSSSGLVEPWLLLNSGNRNQFKVNLTANPSAGGTVTGDGYYLGGDIVRLTATANFGYTFFSYKDTDTNKFFSKGSSSYSHLYLEPKKEYNFEALFTHNFYYTIQAKSSPAIASTITGANEYAVGTAFTLRSSPTNLGKYKWVGWRNDETGEIVSKDYSFGYTISQQTILSFTAVYSDNSYTPSTKPSDLQNDDITDGKATDWMKHGDTGMFAIFNPTQPQLSTLGSWLYSPDFWQAVVQQGILDIDLTSIIVSLSVLPVSITSSGNKSIKIGWVSPVDSQQQPIQISYTNQNYVEVDCGTLTVGGIYNGALDYQTQVEIYLPFIGYKPLETYDAINHSINPIYQVDLMTGDCICKIKIGDSIKYQFTGNCAYSIPLSQVNSNGIVSKGISGAIAAASLTAALMGHPLMATTGGAVMSGGTTTKTTKINRGKTGAVTSRKVTEDVSEGSRTYKSPLINPKEVIGTFTNMGNGIHHGGSLHGNTGYMAVLKPFLNVVRPRLDIPDNFGEHNGYPCNKSLNLGTLNGFTMVDEIHMTGFSCTDSELTEIEQLLTGGVIL